MDKHLTENQLVELLGRAKQAVEVGASYRHYKNKMYTVLDVAILEATNEICVIYQAQYGQRLTFIRPVNVWLEEVEHEGRRVKRFAIVKP